MRRMILGIGAALTMAGGAAAQSPPMGSPDPRGALFTERGCSRCHSIWALGVKAKADVGPDLTFAFVDVVNRLKVTLAAFLNNPGAVIKVMVAPHTQLTAAGRDSVAQVLEATYNEHKAQYKPPVAPDSARPK